MDLEKALTRATIGAALVGLIVVVYALATGSIPATSKGYSELYFEKFSEAPTMMKAGEKYVIPFVVSSNEKKAMSYNYIATFEGAEIARGELVLNPKEKKTLSIDLIPDSSSWNLSSNTSRRTVDSFTIDEVLIKEEKDGDIAAYPVKFDQSALSKETLKILPLNQTGLFSSETQYVEGSGVGKESKITSRLSISEGEIYMEHSSENINQGFKWSNRVQFPDLAVGSFPLIWLDVTTETHSEEKLQRGIVAYMNTPLNYTTGLPGEIYITPTVGMEGTYIISFSTTTAAADKTVHVEKNAVITLHGDTISIKNIIEEETYTYDKAKLSILLSSDGGKSYEIHLWSFVID